MSRKSKVAAITAAQSQATVPAGPQTYLLLREAHSPKLGPRSVGAILFQVLTDPERQSLFLRIAANEGGGHVSDEAVPVQAIRQCISAQPADEPLRAACLKPAFFGKSNNNSGFMTAILVHEGLLARDADKPHLVTDTGRWDAWCAEHMAISGNLTPVRIGKEATSQARTADAAEGFGASAPAGEEVADGAEQSAQASVNDDKPASGRRKVRGSQS